MKKQADFLIIGSGIIGITAARYLAEKGFQVLVLEQGSAITNPPGSHFRNQKRFQDNPDLFFPAIEPYLQPITKQLDNNLAGMADSSLWGGQGILWTNNCPRAMDFELWDAMTTQQWENKYSQAEQMLQVISNPTIESTISQNIKSRLQPQLKQKGRLIRELPLAGKFLTNKEIYFYAPWDILAAASPEVRNKIEIRSGVKVSKIDHQSGQITGVQIESVGNENNYLSAATVLLTGGTIATPNLLFRSGIQPEMLGKGISFHALLFGQIILDADMCPPASELAFSPRLWIPPTRDCPWHIQVLRDTCPLIPTETVDNQHRLIEFQAFLPLQFQTHNQFIMDEQDEIKVQFSFSDDDRKLMRAMQEDVNQLASYLGRWRGGCELTWLPHGAHLMGSCAMDYDNFLGVTDKQGKVHGFENLYLGTLGLIPTPIAINPTLTATAMVLNSCDSIFGL